MLNIEQLMTFHVIVKERGLVNAKNKLNVSLGAVTARLRGLETTLNTRLVHRGRGKLDFEITSHGKILFDFIQEIIPKLESFEEMMRSSQSSITGLLKITSFHGIASFMLPKYICDFQRENPDVLIDICGNNTPKDFYKYESEVLILPYSYYGDHVDMFKVFSIQFNLYASRRYLDLHGAPKTLNDLENHKLISTVPYPRDVHTKSDWHLLKGTSLEENYIKPSIVINSSAGVYNCCVLGEGIGTFPDYYLREEDKKDLVRLFPDFHPPVLDFYYVFEKHMKDIPKIRLFGEYLLKNVPKVKEFG